MADMFSPLRMPVGLGSCLVSFSISAANIAIIKKENYTVKVKNSKIFLIRTHFENFQKFTPLIRDLMSTEINLE